MLDAYIIDAIRQEEFERERQFERRRIWLELPKPQPPKRPEQPDEGRDDAENGPLIIPFRPEIGTFEEEDAA